jgi:hypothetical protein
MRSIVGLRAGTREDRERDRPRPTPAQVWWSFVIVVELGFIAAVLALSLQHPHFGVDYRAHVAAAERLLTSGTPYLPYQLAGPYSIWDQPMPILYPPVAFVLFVPFVWLPPVLWWAIPIAIVVWAMTRHRPPLWAWAATLACFCALQSLSALMFGNPGMWISAFVAAGTVLGWPFALVLIKPSFAPLALLGARRRSWWIAVAVLGAVSLAFGPLWLDWVTAIRNSDLTLAYNLPTMPLMVAPLIPWLADPRHPIHGWIARRRTALVRPAS